MNKLTIFITFLFFTCDNKKSTTFNGLNFNIKLDENYVESKLNSIDSNSGVIICNSKEIIYDIGYNICSQYEFESKDQYITKKVWRKQIGSFLMLNSNNKIIDTSKIFIEEINLLDQTAKVRYKDTSFIYNIVIPSLILKNSIIELSENSKSKEAIRKNSKNQIEYLFLNKKKFNTSINSYECLRVNVRFKNDIDSIDVLKFRKNISYPN